MVIFSLVGLTKFEFHSVTGLLTSMASSSQAQTPRQSYTTSSDQGHKSEALQQVAPASAPFNYSPPVHTLLFAADVYFRFCHNQPYSLFHEATFRQRLVNGEVPDHLVWALLAAARRFATLPELHPQLPDDPLGLAKLSWENLKLPWNGVKDDQEAVSVIQTIVLLVNTEHTCKNGECLWSAISDSGFSWPMHSGIYEAWFRTSNSHAFLSPCRA